MDNDYLIWLKLDGKYVDMTEELYICLCYNVPEGSSRQDLIDSVDIFDRIIDQIVQIKTLTNDTSNVLECGDFDARVSDFPDYVVDESSDHIHVLPADVPLLRVSIIMGHNYLIFASKPDCEF